MYNPASLISPRPPNVSPPISNHSESDSDSDTQNDSDTESNDENVVNVSNNHTENDSESVDENEVNVSNDNAEQDSFIETNDGNEVNVHCEHTENEVSDGSIDGNETNDLNEDLESTFYESSTNVTTERADGISISIDEEEISVLTAPDDVKDPLEAVALNDSELSIFDHIFDENDDDEQPNEDAEEPTNNAQSSNVTIATSPGGTRTFTEHIDEDCVLVYESAGEDFRPQEMGFQVKINDPLSGNIPFKENVSILHSLCNINSIFILIM